MAGDAEELFENAPVGLLATTADGRVVRANATFARWIGIPAAELAGSRFRELLTTGSALFYETRYTPSLRLTGSMQDVALTLRRGDGSELAVIMNATRRADGDGVDVAIMDAAGRSDWERELVRSRRAAELSESRVRTLQSAADAFRDATSEAEVAQALVDAARTAVAAQAVIVVRRDADDELHLIGGADPLAAPELSYRDRPAGRAALTGEPVLIADLDEARAFSPQLHAALRAARLQAVSAVPIVVDGASVGAVVSFFSRHREFDDASSELQLALAAQAQAALRRVALEDELARLALYDQLTGLANRNLLRSRMAEVLATASAHGSPLAVLFVDLDGFKAVNDSRGHRTGDLVLKEVAGRLASGVRDQDTIGRFGGDEFLILCEGVDLEAALPMGERLRLAVREPLESVPGGMRISASIGIAIVDTGREGAPVSAAELVAAADAAMYRSKDGGKDAVTVTSL